MNTGYTDLPWHHRLPGGVRQLVCIHIPRSRLLALSPVLALLLVAGGPALGAGAAGCASPACLVAGEEAFQDWQPVERLRWGYGMSGRDEVALRAYAAEARAGNAAAMFNYGLMLMHGRGVAADPALGRDWIERAFGLGVVSAALALGDLARPGGAGPDDPARAAAYYRFAADQGDVRGMHALGNLHIAGAGMPRSAEEAYFWYLLAAQRGHGASTVARDRLRDILPPAVRMATEARAANWTPTAH